MESGVLPVNNPRLLFLVCISLTLASCASQPNPESTDLPGFWSGFWHGLTAFFALIGHLFNHDIRIYAFPNNGGWYDFGYLFGILCILGGGGSTATQAASSKKS
jgi:hypothetical protein